MAIKPTPIHIREYFKAMKTAFTQRKEDDIKRIEELQKEIDFSYRYVLKRREAFLKYNINVSEYPEFINNEYIDGKLFRVANGAYINKEGDYEIISDLSELLKLAKYQKEIKDINKNIEFYNKVLAIKANEYIRYIRTFFTEVHKHMILNGEGYHFGHHIGNVIINRYALDNKRKTLDYKATAAKKEEILARGGVLYDEASAKFAKENGLKYEFEDHRVYLTGEYAYEVFMANKTFDGAKNFYFTPQDYRAVEIRGKSNKQLIEECNRDLTKICELPVDLKQKLSMCNEVDKTLYTNFIRNENQSSYRFETTCGED